MKRFGNRLQFNKGNDFLDARQILAAKRKSLDNKHSTSFESTFDNNRRNSYDARNELSSRKQNTQQLNFTIPKKTFSNELYHDEKPLNIKQNSISINTNKKVSGDLFSNPKVSVGMFSKPPQERRSSESVKPKFDSQIIKRINNDQYNNVVPIKRKTVEKIRTPPPSIPITVQTVKKPALTTATFANRLNNNSLVSPIQGYRIEIKNLHPQVTVDDVFELFTSLGGELRSCNLVRPGFAEVVFKKLEDASKSIEEFHGRELDGKAMNLKLVTPAVEPSPAKALNVDINNKIAGIQMFRKPSTSADVNKDAVFRSLYSKSSEVVKGGKKAFKFSVTL